MVGGQRDVFLGLELGEPSSVERVEEAGPPVVEALGGPPGLALPIILGQRLLDLLHILDDHQEHGLKLRGQLCLEIEDRDPEGAQGAEAGGIALELRVEVRDEVEAAPGDGLNKIGHRVEYNAQRIQVLEDLKRV